MNHKERMLANLPYKAWLDGLSEERLENKKKIFKFNNLKPGKTKKKVKLLKKILGKTGDYINIEAPFYCDYGYNIEVGENFFANYNFTVLDVGKVNRRHNRRQRLDWRKLLHNAVRKNRKQCCDWRGKRRDKRHSRQLNRRWKSVQGNQNDYGSRPRLLLQRQKV